MILHTSKTNGVINIEENQSITLIDDSNQNLEITLSKGANLSLFGLIYNQSKKVKVYNKENAKSEVSYIFIAENSSLKSKISSKLQEDNSDSNVEIIALVKENGNTEIDGNICLEKDVKNVKGHLTQDNILLHDSAKIKVIPKLLAYSNEIEASHACRVEKIDENKLFYLKSRGIEEKKALELMLESYSHSLFGDLEENFSEEYEKLIEKYSKLIRA